MIKSRRELHRLKESKEEARLTTRTIGILSNCEVVRQQCTVNGPVWVIKSKPDRVYDIDIEHASIELYRNKWGEGVGRQGTAWANLSVIDPKPDGIADIEQL